MDSAHLVIKRVLNAHLLTQMASYDVASTYHQYLAPWGLTMIVLTTSLNATLWDTMTWRALTISPYRRGPLPRVPQLEERVHQHRGCSVGVQLAHARHQDGQVDTSEEPQNVTVQPSPVGLQVGAHREQTGRLNLSSFLRPKVGAMHIVHRPLHIVHRSLHMVGNYCLSADLLHIVRAALPRRGGLGGWCGTRRASAPGAAAGPPRGTRSATSPTRRLGSGGWRSSSRVIENKHSNRDQSMAYLRGGCSYTPAGKDENEEEEEEE